MELCTAPGLYWRCLLLIIRCGILCNQITEVVCRLDGWNSLTELGNHDPTIDVHGTSVDVDGLAINVHGHAIDVDGPAVFSIKSSSPSISSGTKGSDSDAVFSNVDAGLLYFQKL